MSERPTFRPAQIITAQQGDADIASDESERIRLALIDGSRCLPAEWSMRHAPRLASHSDAGVRWAAMFAIDVTRGAWRDLTAEDFFDLVRLVGRVAAEDSEAYVRFMAAEVLTDIIFDLFSTK